VTGIVTPEAVRLEFEPAGVATRMLGFFIDLAVQLAALLALFVVVGLLSSDLSESAAVIITVIGLFLVIFGYPIGSEALWSGKTLGKAALGLRVRTREGAPVRFRHSAIRGSIGFVEIYLLLGVPATISILVTRDSQRLGDLAAGTLVLRERTAQAATASPFTFYPPPGWEPYAASLDVGAMTADQYGLIRGFLLRANEMTPSARSHLALRLANPLAEVLHHQPPQGVHPESFLHCAAAAYQRRHGGADWTVA
jgi:uncharacterized RDD family membrane protein YckC